MSSSPSRARLGAWLVAVALAAAQGAFSVAHAQDAELPSGSSSPVREALRARLADDAEADTAFALDWPRLRAFYAAREFAPAWSGAAGVLARSVELLDVLRRADDDGLEPDDYRVAEIFRLWEAPAFAARAWLDLLLTDAFLRYSADVRAGRTAPGTADPQWFIETPAPDPVAWLTSSLERDEWAATLAELPPAHRGYRRLRQALAYYRGLAARGPWQPLPAGPNLEPGMRHEQVGLLRARLEAEDEWAGRREGDASFYDAPLKAAVERFQARHGLAVDGVVGARTRAALDTPVAERIAQIRRAMERWRWLPRDLGEHYVFVNTAAFELNVIEHDQAVVSMRAIAGTPDQATPAFSGTLTYMVINPYWNIPQRIARESIVPRQQRNPGYFASRRIRLFSNWDDDATELAPESLDWSRFTRDYFPYRLRQDPGPRNSMGRLSFGFPNRFDVFLHDTPERWLFEQPKRAFSEGCIRIEDAMGLALHALREAEEWSEARIRREIDSVRNQTVRLPEPIPVYVVYMTTWVSKEGVVHFREDVYGRDRALARCYAGE